MYLLAFFATSKSYIIVCKDYEKEVAYIYKEKFDLKFILKKPGKLSEIQEWTFAPFYERYIHSLTNVYTIFLVIKRF